LVMRHVEAFQQLDVFFAKALASMMLLLVLNVLDRRAELATFGRLRFLVKDILGKCELHWQCALRT